MTFVGIVHSSQLTKMSDAFILCTVVACQTVERPNGACTARNVKNINLLSWLSCLHLDNPMVEGEGDECLYANFFQMHVG